MPDLQPSSLEIAIHQVDRGRRIVARQRRLIETLASSGCDTSDAERTLDLFVTTLRSFEEQLGCLQDNAWLRAVGCAPG